MTIKDILNVLIVGSSPSIQMIECVITNNMSFANDLFKQCGLFSYVITNTKKSCLRIERSQCIENEIGGAVDGTIVESEIDILLQGIDSPCQ